MFLDVLILLSFFFWVKYYVVLDDIPIDLAGIYRFGAQLIWGSILILICLLDYSVLYILQTRFTSEPSCFFAINQL